LASGKNFHSPRQTQILQPIDPRAILVLSHEMFADTLYQYDRSKIKRLNLLPHMHRKLIFFALHSAIPFRKVAIGD
jgi:hypothetical protein